MAGFIAVTKNLFPWFDLTSYFPLIFVREIGLNFLIKTKGYKFPDHKKSFSAEKTTLMAIIFLCQTNVLKACTTTNYNKLYN